jgi:hypothetical protein
VQHTLSFGNVISIRIGSIFPTVVVSFETYNDIAGYFVISLGLWCRFTKYTKPRQHTFAGTSPGKNYGASLLNTHNRGAPSRSEPLDPPAHYHRHRRIATPRSGIPR